GPKKNSNGSLWPKGELWVLTISVDVIETTEFKTSSAISANEGTAWTFAAGGAGVAAGAGAGAALSARLAGVKWRGAARIIPNPLGTTAKQSSEKRLFRSRCMR